MRARSLDPDLLQPSLQAYAGRDPGVGERPWRPGSLFWIAFFGGVLAITFIAARNATRLRAPQLHRPIVLLGAVAFVLSLVLGVQAAASGAAMRSVRLIVRGVALLVFVVVSRLQRRPDRMHQATSGGVYDSLWKPGLVATLGLGLLEGVTMAIAIRVLS